jgi:hypothetical protein
VEEEVLAEGALGFKTVFLEELLEGGEVLDVYGHARRAASLMAAKAEWWSAWFSPAML